MKKSLALLALIFLIVPMFAFAAATPCTKQAIDSATDKLSELPKCVNQIYVWSLGVGALLALLMLVVGGYSYMTASGNAEQSSKGIEMIWGSVIGIAILFGAYLLLNTINPDLVNFNVSKCLENPSASGCPASTTTPAATPPAPRATPTP